jgi:hypothetical protein
MPPRPPPSSRVAGELLAGRARPWVAGLGVVVAAWVSTTAARADLASDAAAVMSAFRGSPRRHMGPRVVGRSETLPLLLPNELLYATPSGCLQLVALSSLFTQFELVLGGGSDSSSRVPSRGGMVNLVRCGEERSDLVGARLAMLSPQGVVEMLARTVTIPPGTFPVILPRRDLGREAFDSSVPLFPSAILADSPNLAASDEAWLQGAGTVDRRALSMNDLREAVFSLSLAQGCYRVELTVETAPQPSATTLTAAIPSLEGRVVLAESTRATPSPRVEFCLEAPSRVELSAWPPPPPTQAILTTAQYEGPLAAASTFPPRAARAMALGLRRHHLSYLSAAPDRTLLVTQGQTQLSLPLQVGSCYLALLVEASGSVDSLLLAVESERRTWFDAASEHPSFSAVAFCAEGAQGARLTTSLTGQSPTAVLALWSLDSRTTGAVSP